MSPTRLPPEHIRDTRGAAMVIGWNVHNQSSDRISFQTLFYIIVHIISGNECEQYLKEFNISSEKVVCSEKISKQPYCPGESGGALVYKGYLIGITSWALLSCDVTMYTNMSSFKDFILSYVNLD